MVTDCSTTGVTGRSPGAVGTWVIALITSTPSMTSPKIVCLPFSHGVAATVMKNCEPLVPGPALAIASRYGLSNRRSGWISSANL